MEKFKVGDVVYIKSEKLLDNSKRNYMTITGFLEYDRSKIRDVIGIYAEGQSIARCIWFCNHEERVKSFNTNLLEKLE